MAAHGGPCRRVARRRVPVAATSLPAAPARIDGIICILGICITYDAAAHRIPYVDYHTPMLAPDGRSLNLAYSGDGVHPNADGYAVMESLLPRKLLR